MIYGELYQRNPKCAVCGADFLLHHAETLGCPKNGQEASLDNNQGWEKTTFIEAQGDKCDWKSHATIDDSIGNIDIVLSNATTERTCETCRGKGWTAEHSPALNDHDGDGNCLGACPVQVQCEYCEGTGKEPLPAPQNADELEPCPFCGNKEVSLEGDEIGWRVMCYRCGIGHVQHNWTKAYCIESWNRRPSRPMSAEVEKAIADMDEMIRLSFECDQCYTTVTKASLSFALIVAALKERV